MNVIEHELPSPHILKIKRDQTIVRDIFYKILDSKQYLNVKSGHPKHTKINTIFISAENKYTRF